MYICQPTPLTLINPHQHQNTNNTTNNNITNPPSPTTHTYPNTHTNTQHTKRTAAPPLELRFLGAGKGWGLFLREDKAEGEVEGGMAIERGAFVTE
jgi:hypothetical protein